MGNCNINRQDPVYFTTWVSDTSDTSTTRATWMNATQTKRVRRARRVQQECNTSATGMTRV